MGTSHRSSKFGDASDESTRLIERINGIQKEVYSLKCQIDELLTQFTLIVEGLISERRKGIERDIQLRQVNECANTVRVDHDQDHLHFDNRTQELFRELDIVKFGMGQMAKETERELQGLDNEIARI